MRTPSAKISWNRVSKEIRYKSIPKPINKKNKMLGYVDNPALDITFKQQGDKFVIDGMNVLTNGHSSRDLQHKIQNISHFINVKYSGLIK